MKKIQRASPLIFQVTLTVTETGKCYKIVFPNDYTGQSGKNYVNAASGTYTCQFTIQVGNICWMLADQR